METLGDLRWRSSLGFKVKSTPRRHPLKPMTASPTSLRRDKQVSPCSKRFEDRLLLIQSRKGRRIHVQSASKPTYTIASFGNAESIFAITTQRKVMPRLSAKAVTQEKLDYVVATERRHRAEAQAIKPTDRRRFQPVANTSASAETSEIRVDVNEPTDPRVYILASIPRKTTLRMRHRSDVGAKCAPYCMGIDRY